MESFNYEIIELLKNNEYINKSHIYLNTLFRYNFEAVDMLTDSYESYPISVLNKITLSQLVYIMVKGYKLRKDDNNLTVSNNSLLYVVNACCDIDFIKFIAHELYAEMIPLNIRKMITKHALQFCKPKMIIELLKFVNVHEFVNESFADFYKYTPLIFYINHQTIQTIDCSVVAYLIDNGAWNTDLQGRNLIEMFEADKIIRIKEICKYNTLARLLKSSKIIHINNDNDKVNSI